MIHSEIDSVHAIVREKWPRVKWGDGEWSDFDDGLTSLPIEVEQARAALGNLKRTSDKYPTVAGLLKAISGAVPLKHHGASPATLTSQYPSVPDYRAQLACSGIVMPDTASNADIVLAWWKQTLVFRMAAWGDIPPSRQADFAEDCRTMGRMTEIEIAEQWDDLMAYCNTIPLCARRSAVRDRLSLKVRKAVRA